MVPPEKHYLRIVSKILPLLQSEVYESYLSTRSYDISDNSHECSDISISPPPQLMVPRHLWEECLPAADLHHKPLKKGLQKKGKSRIKENKLIVPA